MIYFILLFSLFVMVNQFQSNNKNNQNNENNAGIFEWHLSPDCYVPHSGPTAV
jgi:hypothetical protein